MMGTPVRGKHVKPLTSFQIGEKVKVLYGEIGSPEMFSKLLALGIVPGTTLKIVNQVKAGPVVVEVKGKQIMISREVLQPIYGMKV